MATIVEDTTRAIRQPLAKEDSRWGFNIGEQRAGIYPFSLEARANPLPEGISAHPSKKLHAMPQAAQSYCQVGLRPCNIKCEGCSPIQRYWLRWIEHSHTLAQGDYFKHRYLSVRTR